MAYCKLGDIAITDKAALPENIGKIVRIIQRGGYRPWYGYKYKKLVWFVQSINTPLTYTTSAGKDAKTFGYVPDSFLRPIAPAHTAKVREKEVELV